MDKVRRFTSAFLRAVIICLAFSLTTSAATLSPTLQNQLSGLANSANVGIVIISFNTNAGLNNSHLAILQGVGITNGITLQQLGMVAAPATAGQVRALLNNSAVKSIWSNDRLHYFDNQARTVAGVE